MRVIRDPRFRSERVMARKKIRNTKKRTYKSLIQRRKEARAKRAEERRFQKKLKHKKRKLGKHLRNIVGKKQATVAVVMKKLRRYIRENNLRIASKRTHIVLDEKLAKVVGSKKGKTISAVHLKKLVTRQ